MHPPYLVPAQLLTPRFMPWNKSRSEVAREFGHPWPWKVEELLCEEYEKRDGDLGLIGREFNVHPRTVERWVRRYGINRKASER